MAHDPARAHLPARPAPTRPAASAPPAAAPPRAGAARASATPAPPSPARRRLPFGERGPPRNSARASGAASRWLFCFRTKPTSQHGGGAAAPGGGTHGAWPRPWRPHPVCLGSAPGPAPSARSSAYSTPGRFVNRSPYSSANSGRCESCPDFCFWAVWFRVVL